MYKLTYEETVEYLKEFIKLNYEVEFIKNYLQLESSRFDGKMYYELIV